MKRLLLATTACFGLAAAAQAADLPYRAAPPVYAPPAFTWTGFYVGVNAGYGFNTRDRNDDGVYGFNRGLTLTGADRTAASAAGGFFANNAAGAPVSGAIPFTNATAGATVFPFTNNGLFGNGNDGNRGGFVGGGQIGYNWQMAPGSGFVFGIEADIQYADLNRNRNNNGFGNFGGNTLAANNTVQVGTGANGAITVGGLAAGAANTVTFIDPFGNNGVNGNRGVDWFGTVRGRLGYAFDRSLLYVTGGLAYGGGGNNNNNFLGNNGFGFNNGFNNCGFGNNCGNNTRIGWTVGGGLEYAFTNNLSAKIEGLYVSLGNRDNNNNGIFGFGGAGFVPYARDNNNNTYFANANQFGNNGLFGNRRREGEFAVVRAGLNYRFSYDVAPAPAPVVARY